MKQQYILLRKDNDLLNSLIGQSFNQKSKFEAYKILKQIHKKADQYSIEKALCYIVDNGEIKAVGGSSLMQNKKTGEIVSDLILNQFGVWLAGLCKGSSATFGVSLNDQFNVSRSFNTYGGVTFNNSGVDNKIELLIGSGITLPARSDFNIETAFGTPPESLAIVSSNPVFNTSLGNFKNAGSITAGGSGTINESVFRSIWDDTGSVTRGLSLFRDIISPAASFILGQTIALEYTVQL